MDRLADRSDDGELVTMLDMLSTNVTEFFREPQHFEFIGQTIVPGLLGRKDAARRLRIWSAGCSTGEEPYSIAMQVHEQLTSAAGWETQILPTDLSTRVLRQAREGLYPEARLKGVAPMWKSRYFTLAQVQPQRMFRVSDAVRHLVHFARLNLVESWPMRGPFEMIFCRNVMIYFDKPTQSQLVNRFTGLLASGGYLFLGHSESLAGVKHGLEYVQPTIYRKP